MKFFTPLTAADSTTASATSTFVRRCPADRTRSSPGANAARATETASICRLPRRRDHHAERLPRGRPRPAGWRRCAGSSATPMTPAVGGDDLLGSELDRRRAQVGVTELPLSDLERDALAAELERMRVAQLVRRAPAPDACVRGEPQGSRRTARQTTVVRGVGPSMMQNSGPAGSSGRATSHGRSCSQPRSPRPTSRPRPPLPLRTSTDPRRRSRSCWRAQRLLDTRPGAPNTTMIARSLKPWRSLGAWCITATISSTVGGSAR
jgi:hypothetical protein